jgi:hypothetical protein
MKDKLHYADTRLEGVGGSTLQPFLQNASFGNEHTV